MLKLAKLFLFSPSEGAKAAQREENFAPNLRIYVAFLAGSLIFFWLKPFDFPDKNAPVPLEAQNLWFWIKVAFWQPPLELAWIVFLMGLIQWFRHGSWPVRLACGVAWTAFPFVMIVSYKQMSTTLFAAGFVLWTLLFYPLIRKAGPGEWWGLASYMLGLNAIGIVMLGLMTLATAAGSSAFFSAAQAVGGLWMLGAATLGLRELAGLRLPRAFMAVLLSMFFQIALAFDLHLLGLVPKEILKALFYA